MFGFEIRKGDLSFSKLENREVPKPIRVPSEERCVKSIKPSLSVSTHPIKLGPCSGIPKIPKFPVIFGPVPCYALIAVRSAELR